LEEARCREARALDSEEGWLDYLDEHPIGPCSAEARERLLSLPCDEARTANSAEGWRTYLELHPGGLCAAEGVSQLQSLLCGGVRRGHILELDPAAPDVPYLVIPYSCTMVCENACSSSKVHLYRTGSSNDAGWWFSPSEEAAGAVRAVFGEQLRDSEGAVPYPIEPGRAAHDAACQAVVSRVACL